MPWLHFIKYNNAVPIGISLLLLSFGTAMAASPEVRDTVENAVLASEESVISIDNTYLVNKDLDDYTPLIEIKDVEEDDEFYYIRYEMTTIDIIDYVWKDVIEQDILQVSKADMGQYRDLGVYVTEELKEKIDRELAYLKEAQKIEQRIISQKVVATAYKGLVGKFLDDSTEVIPGYVPLVTQPKLPKNIPISPKDMPKEIIKLQEEAEDPVLSDDVTAPFLQLLGESLIRIPVGGVYQDLGVVVTDEENKDVPINIYVNGFEANKVEIDTTVPGEWFIQYWTYDPQLNLSVAERRVVVFDPNPSPEEEPTVEESPDEEPPVEIPPETPPAEEPPTEEPPVEAPPTEELPAETLPETSPVEEPPTETPPTDSIPQSSGDETSAPSETDSSGSESTPTS